MARSRIALLIVVVAGLLTVAACQPESASPGAGPTGHKAKVPRVVGQRLTDAERTLSRAGFNNVQAVDGTGQNRIVLDQKNWVVSTQTPSGSSSAYTGERVTLKVGKPTDKTSPTHVTHGVVPNVICANLQDAQNSLQAAGFRNLGSADGLGAGRHQLLDRDWLVTKQSAAAGSKPKLSTHIVLTAVKYGESTGSSGCHS